MRSVFAWVVSLLLASTACGQVDLLVTKYNQVSGLKSPLVIGDKVLVESIGTLTTKSVALLVVQSDSDDIRVEASDIRREPVVLEKLAEGTYFLSTQGKVWVEAKEYIEIEIGGVKRKLLADSKTVVVELGSGPDPGPGPGPTPPPTKCDAKTNSNFDYLAKRACAWEVGAAGVFKRADVAKIYLTASEKLLKGEHISIGIASDAVRKQWDETLNTEEIKTAWASWSMKANEELAKHWQNQTTNTAKRELIVQFFRSLGEGLQP